MRMICKLAISLTVILLSAPLVLGQDLSKYRNYSLGTSFAQLSKQVRLDSPETSLIHRNPAVIQELAIRPTDSSRYSARVEPVSQILFSFYNGELYRISVTYDRDATEGLTAEDMVQAISAKYGVATKPIAESFPTNDLYDSTEEIIARWEDSQNSVNLFHSSFRNSFGLAVFSKRLDAQAKAAIAEAVKLEEQEAPQKEVARLKKDADNLEEARLKNKKTFRR